MSDTAPILPSAGQAAGVQQVAGVGGARRAGASGGEGALAFKALLDQLEQRAQALESTSRKELAQGDLPGAVDNARESLEQMLSLKDQLLEAWRASQHSGGGSGTR